MVKDRFIQIRVSAEEKAELCRAAKVKGLTVSRFLMDAAEDLAKGLGEEGAKRWKEAAMRDVETGETGVSGKAVEVRICKHGSRPDLCRYRECRRKP